MISLGWKSRVRTLRTTTGNRAIGYENFEVCKSAMYKVNAGLWLVEINHSARFKE